MRKQFALLLCTMLSIVAASQSPQKFSYQSVIRNAGNQLVANQQVGIKISILQGEANGTAVYAETHSPLSNANGLVTLEIGGGAVLSGNFANINWASGPYFVKTETDLNGGSTYTLTHTQQLLSVPYALYANDVSSSVSDAGDTLYIGSNAYIVPGISAANNAGGQTGITAHTCGATNVHNPAKTYGTMTDQQGNVYRTIVIGNQEWMAENLKTSIYRNGESIANVSDSAQWSGITSGAWCFYKNDNQYECPYGKLYNGFSVVDSRNLCPSGWHLPSNNEWDVLKSYVGGGNNSGLNLMSDNISYWEFLGTSNANSSGFSALPSLMRWSVGYFPDFIDLDFHSFYWSATQLGKNTLSTHAISGWDSILGFTGSYSSPANYGYSIRCLRD